MIGGVFVCKRRAAHLPTCMLARQAGMDISHLQSTVNNIAMLVLLTVQHRRKQQQLQQLRTSTHTYRPSLGVSLSVI